MLSPKLREALAAPTRTLRIIWFAFFAAIIIYVLIAHFLSSKLDDAGEPMSTLLPVLACVAAADLAFGAFMHRSSFSEAALEQALQSAPTAGAPGLEPHEQRLLGLMPYVQQRLIIVWASVEAAAIFGLLLVFLRFEWNIILPFAVAACIGMLLFRPQPESIIERAAKLIHKV